MSLVIHTKGSCIDEMGTWHYSIHYRNPEGELELIKSTEGESPGTTSRQMKLMAILNALDHAKTLGLGLPIILHSDCRWCVKCIRREYDCVSDNEYKREKVARGYVQYLQEIWWKLGGMDITFSDVQG